MKAVFRVVFGFLLADCDRSDGSDFVSKVECWPVALRRFSAMLSCGGGSISGSNFMSLNSGLLSMCSTNLDGVWTASFPSGFVRAQSEYSGVVRVLK